MYLELQSGIPVSSNTSGISRRRKVKWQLKVEGRVCLSNVPAVRVRKKECFVKVWLSRLVSQKRIPLTCDSNCIEHKWLLLWYVLTSTLMCTELGNLNIDFLSFMHCVTVRRR